MRVEDQFQVGHSVWKSPKKSHWNFSILVFSTNFCPIESDMSVNTVWLQASGYQKLAKITLFEFLISFLATPNVNVARLACNVEWDFLNDFQALCMK